MGTIVDVTVVSEEGKGQDIVDAAFREMKMLEVLLSEWREDSEVSAVNRKSGVEPVHVGPETLEVVTKSLYWSRASDGAFDIAWAALRHIWDFSDSSPHVPPSEKDVAPLLHLVNYRNIIVDPAASTVFLKEEGMEIGLGGIAKGYIVGRAAALLMSRGAKGGLISAGGNMTVWGRKENGDAWTIGVQDPVDRDRLLGLLKITEGSVSTSGDYERFYVYKGKRYHHIIDPKTGFPAQGCHGVTVVCSDATDADAVSKVPFILGPKKGLKFVDKAGCRGLVVDMKGEVFMDDGMKRLLEEARQ